MRAWMSVRDVLDMVEEEVALRAGLLLTDHDVFHLLDGSPIEAWSQPLRLPAETAIGIRPEFFEDLARVLRAAVGNLPDAVSPEAKRFGLLGKLGEAASEVPLVLEALTAEAIKRDPPIINAEVVDAVTNTGQFLKTWS